METPVHPSKQAAADIGEIKARAGELVEELQALKASLAPPGFWYPYSTLHNVIHLDSLLTGRNRHLTELIPPGPIADIGGADGDLAFLLERLGYDVHLIDNRPTNFNHFRGAEMLKQALGSRVVLHDVDLDSQFTLPAENYGAVFFLGILYHLKNPYFALERLAKVTRFCFLSTRIAQVSTDHVTRIERLPVAYLLDPLEANEDPTNYWIFSDAGLRRLLDRTGWRVRDYLTVGNTVDSEPASAERDERAFCLVEASG